jgi:photosystem II stability/assembly factor-like uncharacterized protein
MKKVQLLVIAFFLFFNAFGQQVEKNEAEEIAKNFMQHVAADKQKEFKVKNVIEGKHKSETTSYIFNFADGGFIITSANKRAEPILGYSKNSSIPKSYKELTNFNKWFSTYNKTIHQIKSEKLPSLDKKWGKIEKNNLKKSATSKEVSALLTTKWGQSNGYNKYAPEGVPIGCVATAMAQVMNYHEFPAKGVSWHQYEHPDYGIQKAYFDTTTYNWGSMPDEQSNDAIAELMYHCAVSVDMNFNPSGSGASDVSIPLVMDNYFKYTQSMDYVYKSEYTDSEWINLLKSELDNSRPILYSGTNDNSGHEFVCDGYDSNDNFHFNWGWEGAADGYYAIGNLNPQSTSFNQNNAAVIGLEPGTGASEFTFVKKYSDFPQKSTYPFYIDAVSSEVAWAVGADGSGNGQDMTVFTTTHDGGGSWSGEKIDCNATAFSMISGISADSAFIAAYGSASDNQILRTTDGGDNWEEVLSGAGNSSFFNVVHFFNSTDGFVQGDPEGGEFELYTTSDGGDSWTRIDGAEIPDPTADDEYGTVGHYTAVEDTIWFTTNYGRIYKSEDKGHTWEVSTVYSGEYSPSITIAFDESGQVGIADVSLSDGSTTVKDTLYKTTDGGQNWAPVDYSGNFYHSGISSIPGEPNTFVSVGADYETPAMGVSFTNDGGNTWNDLTEYYKNMQFIGVDFSSTNRGYAGGFQGEVGSGMYVYGEPFAELIADFKVEDDQGIDTAYCISSNLTVTSQANGYIKSYEWDFGENAQPTTATGIGPHTINYKTRGEKNITLTVKDSANQKTTSTHFEIDSIVPGTIDTVTGPRTIDLTGVDSKTETYSAPQFIDVSYSWSFPYIWTGSSDSSSIDITFSGAPTEENISVNIFNACGMSSYSFTVETIDNEETAIWETGENDIKIYPQPASKMLTLDNVKNARIQIYNMNGVLMDVFESTNTKENINISDYRNGVYFIHVVKNGNNFKRKLIISK